MPGAAPGLPGFHAALFAGPLHLAFAQSLFPPAKQGRTERTFHQFRTLLRALIQRDDIGYADTFRDVRDLLNRIACREVPPSTTEK